MDSDQTVPTRAVCAESTLFVKVASRNLQQMIKADDLNPQKYSSINIKN